MNLKEKLNINDMTKQQKQELFDAITSVGYKETELALVSFLNGEALLPNKNMQTILAWFNLWHIKGDFDSDIQSVISFIQANTYTNPSTNTKSKKTNEITDDFKKQWFEKFGVEVKKSISVNIKKEPN